MSLVLATAVSALAAFATDSSLPQEQAQRRSAQVRSSILSGNWEWLSGLTDLDRMETVEKIFIWAHRREETSGQDVAWGWLTPTMRKVLFPIMAKWCSEAPSLKTCSERVILFHRALVGSGEAREYDEQPFRTWLELPWESQHGYPSLNWYQRIPHARPGTRRKLYYDFDVLLRMQEGGACTVLTWDVTEKLALLYWPDHEIFLEDPVEVLVDWVLCDLRQNDLGSLAEDADDELAARRGGLEAVKAKLNVWWEEMLDQIDKRKFNEAKKMADKIYKYCTESLELSPDGDDILGPYPWQIDDLIELQDLFQ